MFVRISFFIMLILLLMMNANVALTGGYNISKVLNPPEEYLAEKNKIEERYTFYAQDNWRLPFSPEKYIETEVSGKTKDREGNSFETKSLYVVIKGEKHLIEKGYYDYGYVVWNSFGTQFVYQAIEEPPVDFPIGTVYVVMVDELNNAIEKKRIVENIGYSHFAWAKGSNKVAFADFEAVYVFDSDKEDLQVIIGDWDASGKYEKGLGYPRLCDSFVWLNNDSELYFTYFENFHIFDREEYYKIAF